MHIFMGVVACIYLLVVGGFVIWTFHKGWGPWVRDRLKPVERMRADVAVKEEERDFSLPFNEVITVSRGIAFRCEDGKTRVYEVSETVFDMVEENDHGILLFRGDTFVGFEPARVGANPDDVYRRLVR